ncbi:hypothetical protein BC831DRAFT_202290 [Entophlyctis helioformis]|nr:hypothetical protein BC831DRAFT_202290 [Entophlyctis helioformis]
MCRCLGMLDWHAVCQVPAWMSDADGASTVELEMPLNGEDGLLVLTQTIIGSMDAARPSALCAVAAGRSMRNVCEMQLRVSQHASGPGRSASRAVGQACLRLRLVGTARLAMAASVATARCCMSEGEETHTGGLARLHGQTSHLCMQPCQPAPAQRLKQRLKQRTKPG